jgi:hypothetical protein
MKVSGGNFGVDASLGVEHFPSPVSSTLTALEQGKIQ